MKHIFSFILILSILLPSVPVQAAKKSSSEFVPARDCHEGKCVDQLAGLLEAKIKAAGHDRCLPPSSVKNRQAWFENHAMSMDCFRQLREIDDLYNKLEKVQLYLSDLSEKGTCVNCGKNKTPVNDILGNIGDIDSANSKLSCSPQRKKAIWSKCGSDAMCVLISSSLTVMGPLANKMIPSSLKAKGCRPTQDSCLTQLAMGFVKSVFSLFEGFWDLLKSAGSYAKKKMTNLWHWVRGAENKSSTAQLAAAKASENEGVFKQLMHDFGGTMSRLWTGLLAAIKEWLRSSVFCQEWSGVPQFSTCKRPAQGLDCLECKTMINGMCSLTGTIVAEIIPAFLTGGMVTAAKYGAEGAVKIAKLFKVSSATARAIKESKLASLAVKTATKVSKAVKAAEIASTVSRAVKLSYAALRAFMVKPVVKIAKYSIIAMRAVARAAKVNVVISRAGPVITFGTKALKTAGKVVIFPFDNAMTTKAFHLGEKSMEQVIKKSSGWVATSGRPMLTGEAARGMSLIDQSFKDVTVARVGGDPKLIQSAEAKYLQVAREQRGHVIDGYLKNSKGVRFDDLIEEFYPELNYSKSGAHSSSKEIVKAEEELWAAISRMPASKLKDSLTLSYQSHVTSLARKNVIPASQSFSREEVLKNASLTPDVKVEEAIKLTDRSVTDSQKAKMAKALEETQSLGDGGVLKYGPDDLQKQQIILVGAGFTKEEAGEIINSGLAGKVKPEDQYVNLRKVAIPDEKVVEEISQHPTYGKILISQEPDRRPAFARAIRVLENSGAGDAQVAQTFKRFEKNFNHVQKLGGKDSDAASLLAEYIQRQKKAGLADDVIQKKIDEAFGACK